MVVPTKVIYKDYFMKSFASTIKFKDYVKQLFSEFNDVNIEKTLTLWAKDFIKSHNSSLDIKEYFYFKYQLLPNYVFLLVLTHTQTNHPYMVYADVRYNTINFVLPFGENRGQIPLEYLNTSINNKELSKEELNILYVYLQKNIVNRKNAILNVEQFSLLNCSNISNCHKKMNEIHKMRVSSNKKKELIKYYQNFYQKKAVEFIGKYFYLLENKDFDEAFLFLRGSKGKYFGKQRLNTFFKNSKKIVGHLHIFITLYQILHLLYQEKTKRR